MHDNNRINNNNISKVCTFAIQSGNKRKQSVFNVVFFLALPPNLCTICFKK